MPDLPPLISCCIPGSYTEVPTLQARVVSRAYAYRFLGKSRDSGDTPGARDRFLLSDSGFSAAPRSGE
jgi:hypothetical protein